MPKSFNVITNTFVVLDEGGAGTPEVFNSAALGYTVDYPRQRVTLYERGSTNKAPITYSYLDERGTIQLQQGIPVSPPVNFATFDDVVDALRNFSLAAASVPAGGIEYQTAQVINSTSEFEYDEINDEFILPPGVDNILYIIDTLSLDLGTTPFRLVDQTIGFFHWSPGRAVIASNEDAYDMFVGWGTINAINVIFTASGIASSIFNGLAPTLFRAELFLRQSVFASCTEIGFLDGFDRITILDCEDVGCSQGISFAGSIPNGSVIRGYNSRNSSGTMFAGDVSLSTAQLFFLQVRTDRAAATTFYDFAPGNFSIDGAFKIQDHVNAGPIGTFVANTTKGHPTSEWSGNRGTGVENTEPGFSAVQNANSTTVIGASTNWFIMTTSFTVLDNDYFTDLGGGQFQYDAQTPRKIFLEPVVSIQGGVNQQYDIGLAINGVGTIVGALTVTTSLGIAGNTSENLSPKFPQSIVNGDTIQLAVRKVVGANTDPVLLTNSTFVATFASS